MNRVGRAVATCLAAATSLAVAPPASAAAAQARPDSVMVASPPAIGPAPAEPEQVVVEVYLGRWASRAMPALRDGDEVLLPVAQLLELAGIRAAVAVAEGCVSAVVHPRRWSLDACATSDTLRFGPRAVPAPPARRVVLDGELYVGGTQLGRLLDVDVIPQWADLAVIVERADELPVARRAVRDADIGALALRAPANAEAFAHVPLARSAFDGVVLDYLLSAPSDRPVRSAGYGFSLGADVAGGSLEGVVAGTLDEGGRGQGSWTGVWRDNPWVRQLRLGDAASTGPAPRGVRGVVLGNSPWLRPSAFSMLPFPGELPPGWAVDAYRLGELVGIDSVDESGRYALTLPVQYGDNPVDFVARGPYGEERRFSSTYRVRPEFVPPGHLEYGVAAGRCTDRRSCDATANVDLRYGVHPRLTMRAGTERFWRDTLPDRWHPYLGLAGNLTNALGLRLDGVAGALAHAGLTWEPTVDARLSIDGTRYREGDVVPALAPGGWRSRTLLTGFWRPAGTARQTFVEGTAERVAIVHGTSVQRARLAMSWQQGWMRWVPHLRLEHDATRRAYAGATAYVVPGRRVGALLDRTWIRATAEASRGAGVGQGAVTLSRQLTRMLQLEATTVWMPGARGPTYALTLTTNHDAVRAYTTMSAARGIPASATQLVQGSVVHDRAGGRAGQGRGFRQRTMLVPGPSLQRAGVAGRVFLDADGDGVYDAGEPPIGGVFVRVGPVGALTDSTGAFIVWDLPAFEPVAVQVDSGGLLSPLWVPATAGTTVELAPNRFLPFDVPILAGGTVDGMVRRVGADGASGPLGGVRLLLREVASGARRSLLTFGDGTFSAMALRPGRWEAVVDPAMLAPWGLMADTVHFTVRPNVDGDQVTGVTLDVRAAPADAMPARTAPQDTFDSAQHSAREGRAHPAAIGPAAIGPAAIGPAAIGPAAIGPAVTAARGVTPRAGASSR